MDDKYIDPFLNSIFNILPQLGIANIEKSNIFVKDNKIVSPGLIIIVGILGDIKGNVIYGTSIECAKKIAEKMMMGMIVDDFNELAKSAISELANMVTANAATNFFNDNMTIDISTPTLIYGDFTANASTEQVLCVELLVDKLPFYINIALDKK